MKNIILITLLSLTSPFWMVSHALAQNLVPNPSFEIHSGCPQFYTQLYLAVGWTSYRITPDYFNACANIQNPNLGVPVNAFGHQNAFDGNAYIGLICYHSTVVNVREYAGVQLLQPLNTGQRYFITFYVSLADTLGFNCPSSKVGVKFSTQPFSDTIPAPITNSAHVFSQSIISDRTNWTPVSGSFVADSAYQYLMIGNFFDDMHTDTANCFWYSYYYVDNICVSTDSLDCPVITSIQEHNPSNLCEIFLNSQNEINITTANNFIQYVEIYNAMGQIILTDNNAVFENKKISLKNYSKGVYICKVYSQNKLTVKKIIVNN